MSDARRRQRKGLHESLSGELADETLQDLVGQFADPFAFVRELIQNSLDAGAGRIEVEMRFADGALTVAVRDDGEGMDRETIEGYLLTLFRSTKEQDLTKIGKFGIGFVSLFAMKPDSVTVDTGRDGVWHRVVFHADRSYTLMRLEDPFEGTTVSLHLPRTRKAATSDAAQVRESAERWCRFAAAEILTSCEGLTPSWPPTPVAAPFTVDAPVVVRQESDGFLAVMGPARQGATGGFYNYGLTLWEGDNGFIPGVTFRVQGRHLEHTLTRDNVIRDRHFDEVMRRLQAMARAELGEAVHRAVAEAVEPERQRALFAAMADQVPWTWDEKAPLVPAVGRPGLSIAELEALGGSRLTRLFSKANIELLFGAASDPLAVAVAATGRPVVATADPDHPALRWALARSGAMGVPVRDRFLLIEVGAPSPPQQAVFDAANALLRGAGRREVLSPCTPLTIPGDVGEGLALSVREPAGLRPLPLPAPRVGDPVVVSTEHPLWADLLRLPPAVAAPLLVSAVGAAVGAALVAGEALVLATVAALPRKEGA